MEANVGGKQIRFRSIDGLRGLAAMAVVLYHLSGNLQPELEVLLPSVINTIFSYGFLGVPIFFVISGFVISFGVGSTKITAGYTGNFILRRSVRLDITYWASIFMAICLLLIKNEFLGSEKEIPSFSDVFLHMFYLQDLLNVKPVISVVYWTLCLEVQLYLFYIFSLWLAQKISANQCTVIHLGIILALGIYSICLDLNITDIGINGLFLSSWHYFLLGVLISNAVRGGKYGSTIFIVWLVIEILFQFGVALKAYTLSGICISFCIFLMWKFNKLNYFLTGKLFAYLGTISYSLYLVHPDIGWKVISLGKLIVGDSLSPMIAGVLLVFGILVSVFVAHIFNVMFEKPTLILAKRLKYESALLVFKSLFKTNK